MDRVYLSFIIAIFFSAISLAVKVDNNESNRILQGKACGVRIGCYNASVTKPSCGNGIVTYSQDLKYTAEFKLVGCDGRRLDGAPVSWREISASAADNEISSCRNQYRCPIPIGIIQRRIGNPLVLEIWTSIAPLHKLVRLGVVLNVRPPADVVSTNRSQYLSVQTTDSGTKTTALRTKSRTTKKLSIRKSSKHPSKAKTFEDLIIEHLANRAMLSQRQERKNNRDGRIFNSKSRTIGNDRKRIGRLNIAQVTRGKPGRRSHRLDTQKNKLKIKKKQRKLIAGADIEMSVWGAVDRVNVTSSNVTGTALTGAESITTNHSAKVERPTAKVNVTDTTEASKIHNNTKLNVNTGLNNTLNTTPNGVSMHREDNPLSLNITLIKHGTWTKGSKSKLKIQRKMEVRIKSNISDANTALDSILTATSQKGKGNKHHGYVQSSASGKDNTRRGKQQHTIDPLLYDCVKFLCGKHGRRLHCPKILVLQCLHLSSGERRQLMLGDIREEVQQLIDMFNVSQSDLKEIKKSAKASAHQLMTQGGNANIISKKIGIATAEILRKLYNTSYLASRAAIKEGFAWSGENARMGSVRGFGEWSNWSHCSASCGTGITTRSRVCPPRTVDCRNKSSHETRNCMKSSCHKVHPHLPSPWSSWSTCSVTCGLGQETRSRACDTGTGREAKTHIPGNIDRCKGPITMVRLCIMATCNTDSNTWRKTVLLGYDTVLSCGSPRSWSSPQTYWITPGGNRVSRTAQLPRIYMVGNTLVIHGTQKVDEGVYHCIIDRLQPSQVATTDTRIEVLTCSSAPCENGGTCQERSHSFRGGLRQVTCSCRSGFGGRRCQDRVSHTNSHLFLLAPILLIGLLFSIGLGFFIYVCAHRKTEQEEPNIFKQKDVKNTPGDEPQMLEPLDEEADVSTNLDSSIIHSDDSWIEISEKDYKDFQGQSVSSLHRHHGAVSHSLPALDALSIQTSIMSPHPMVERKSGSNTETRSRQDYDDIQLESRTQIVPKQHHGYKYEVPTSPDIKSRILLIKPDQNTKSTPDFKTKKTVSFQVNDSIKNDMNKKSRSMTRSPAQRLSFTSGPASQYQSTTSSSHQVSSASGSERQIASTSPLMSTTSSVSKMSSLSNEDNDDVDMSGARSAGNELAIITSDSILGLHGDKTKYQSTASSSHQVSLAAGSEPQVASTSPLMSTTSSVGKMSSLPNEDSDYVDMSGARSAGNELAIITSDSILGLHGDETKCGLDEDVDIVHRRTFSPLEQHAHSKLVENVEQSEDHMTYTPVYYTYQPSPTDNHDMYVDMCEFVHRKTYFPETGAQHAQSEQLYINLMDKPDTYPDYEIPTTGQAKQYPHPVTIPHQIEEDCVENTTSLEYDEDKSAKSEDVSLNHETNSSNHSYTDDPSYKLDQIVSDSQQLHQSTSLDNVRSVECQEMNSAHFPNLPMPSAAFEEDDERYDSDQSSTLCPMPDLDESEFLDEDSWDATLKDNQIEDSAKVVDSLVRCFESEKNRSVDIATKTESALKLPNDTDGMTSAFHVSLGDLLDGVDNDRLFGHTSSEDGNGHDSSLSVCSDNAHRDTEASERSSNGSSRTEIRQHTQTSNNFGINNPDLQQQPTAADAPKTISTSSPMTRMCRGHYEMVYGPVSYPSPLFQLDSESGSDVTGMTEVDTQPPQVYPIDHYYASKTNSDFP